ncbi:MAG: methylenetetrahydrofolate reductase [Woeseia sp.]
MNAETLPAVTCSFQQAVRSRDFVITVQVPLRPMTTATDLCNAVRQLQPFVDAVQITDNVTIEPHMSPIAAASLVLGIGMDAVLHLNCRDRNRIALQSDVMGAAAIGVTSFVLSRGEKLPASLKQRVKGVFDIGAKRLLATAQVIGMNERLVASPGFFLGSNITVIDPPEDWSAEGVDTKADAGSKFLQTQPCLDVEILRRYMAALIAKKALQKTSVIVQVPLLDSMDAARDATREFQQGRRTLLIPKAIVARLRAAPDFSREVEAVCSDVLREIAKIPGVSGANIVYRSEARSVCRVIDASGLRSTQPG